MKCCSSGSSSVWSSQSLIKYLTFLPWLILEVTLWEMVGGWFWNDDKGQALIKLSTVQLFISSFI